MDTPHTPRRPVQLLTTQEVAETLRLRVERVRELVRLGVLQPVQFVPNGNFRFRTADVERLIGSTGGDLP
jgi:excisionase family DNA binding protein